jgi:hypothetical protein
LKKSEEQIPRGLKPVSVDSRVFQQTAREWRLN